MPDMSDTTIASSSDRFVRIERHDNGVVVLRLDRPKVNAISPELADHLFECVEELNADLPSAVVVYGGERMFAAGADIARFGGPAEARVIGAGLRRALDGLAGLPRVTIAAVTGFALGGGCELAMACDLRLMSDTAKFGQPEILLGIIPGAGGTQRLTRLVGLSRAKDIVLSGRQVAADEALRIGLADRVVPAADVLASALAWANEFAAGPVSVQALAKRAVNSGMDGALADGLTLEQDLFAEAFGTDDAKIGIKSFLENGPGKAQFTGR